MTWPEALVSAVVLLALLAYTLTGGADYGGGVLDLLAVGPHASAQRKRIAQAIGPIWEANHVWLILVIVLLFVAFPHAFAAISISLHIPLVLMLVGVVLRGTSFVYRAHDTPDPVVQLRWSAVFAAASAVTPLMLGICLGAVASGAIRVDVETHRVLTDFFTPWLAPFPIAVGLFTLALFTSLAAVYLTVETEGSLVQEAFRIRALGAVVVTGVLAYLCLALAWSGAPRVFEALTARWWSLPFQAVTAALGLTLLAALWTWRFALARVLVVLLTIAVEVGWTMGQLPFVVPPDLDIPTAAAPDNVLRSVLVVLAVGCVALVPALVTLYAVFKSQRRASR